MANAYRQGGSRSARSMNDLESALNCLDQLWVDGGTFGNATTLGFVGATSGGVGQEIQVIPTGWTCDGTSWQPSALAWGIPIGEFDNPSAINTDVQLLISSAAEFGYPIAKYDPYWVFFRNGIPEGYNYFDNYDDEYGTCNGDTKLVRSVGVGNWIQFISRDTIPGTQYFGSTGGILSTPGETQFSCSFGLAGHAYNPPGWMLTAPDGTEVLEAKAWVRMDDLQFDEYVVEGENPVTGRAGFHYVTYNGALIVNKTIDAAGVVTNGSTDPNPGSSSEGSIAFALMGVRRDSRQVTAVDSYDFIDEEFDTVLATYAADEYRGLGVSVPASVVSDEWAEIDLADALNGYLRNRKGDETVFEFWPSIGLQAMESAASAANYLRSLEPEKSVTLIPATAGVHPWTYAYEMTFRYVEFSGLEFAGDILCRVRFPSGVVDDLVLHVPRGPLVRELG